MDRFLIPVGRLLVRDPQRPELLTIHAGTAWVTQAGDHRDHVLRAGRSLSLHPGARVVVQVLGNEALAVECGPVAAPAPDIRSAAA